MWVRVPKRPVLSAFAGLGDARQEWRAGRAAGAEHTRGTGPREDSCVMLAAEVPAALGLRGH